MTTNELTCSKCGKSHSPEEIELVFTRPDAIVVLSGEQRSAEVRESDELCAIRNDRFFVRALLPLYVAEWGSDYCIGVWAEVGGQTFNRIRELWSEQEQAEEPPFEAWLANEIPSFSSTCGLPVRLQLTGPTTRPRISIPESEHPLHKEQCLGISAHRAGEYTGRVT